MTPSIVYHEYTHGLSNRLIIDTDGDSRARRRPVRRDGRGVERLVRARPPRAEGLLERHAPGSASQEGRSTSTTATTSIRTEPIDCPPDPDTPTANCPGNVAPAPAATRTPTSVNVRSAPPEVHSDGEIWVQTLWELRQELVAKLRAAGRLQAGRGARDRRHGARGRPRRRTSTSATGSCRRTPSSAATTPT